MWAFRKQPGDLRPEEQRVLRKLWEAAPKLKQAYDFRQQLTAIFEQDISKTIAKRKIQAWIEQVQLSGLKYFDEFLKTLEHWREEITNYFID
jgi:transposase